MTIERGAVLGGRAVAGTDWILRDPAVWWGPGERGTKPRARVVDVIVLHWTAGEAGGAPFTDDGPFVVKGMKARKNPKTGELMKVGCDFLVGGCDPDGEPLVWQTNDPGLQASIHVGTRLIYPRSIGIEVVNEGHDTGAPSSRPKVSTPFGTKLDFWPGQHRAVHRLVTMLCTAPEARAAGIHVPAVVPGELVGGTMQIRSRRFDNREARRAKGVIEHCHVPSTQNKTDAATLHVRSLVKLGGFEIKAVG